MQNARGACFLVAGVEGFGNGPVLVADDRTGSRSSLEEAFDGKLLGSGPTRCPIALPSFQQQRGQQHRAAAPGSSAGPLPGTQ